MVVFRRFLCPKIPVLRVPGIGSPVLGQRRHLRQDGERGRPAENDRVPRGEVRQLAQEAAHRIRYEMGDQSLVDVIDNPVQNKCVAL